jgi:hypothetical protein
MSEGTVIMTEKPQHPPIIDPDMVPEVLCDGQFNISISHDLATLTFTHARANPTEMFLDGRIDPSYVVRARIVIPIKSLIALRDVLSRIRTKPAAPATVSGGPTIH